MTDLKKGKDLSEHLKSIQDKEDGDKRARQCEMEIIASLEKHNCSLEAVMIIGRNGNLPQITIVAKNKV
jgi:uncharacterized protein YejL (UPF0352 family)